MNKIFTISMVALLVVFTLGIALADPNGADTITPGASTRAGPDSAQSHDAIAGNVTEITIEGDSITQTWQGYFGNVSGAIKLEDSSGNALYNWTLLSPSGEVFASPNDSITWSGVQCFDLATNVTQLESYWNISATAADGVDETFSNTNDHSEFSVGATTIAANSCYSADIFDSSLGSNDGVFEEVLLSEATWQTGRVIFAALLEEDQAGFDTALHDFEMLVLEDGHSGDSTTTPYFFYVELE
jgi:hypothetical protein